MTVQEIRNMNIDEIILEIKERKKKIATNRVALKSLNASSDIINEYRQDKKAVAKLNTVLHEKKLLELLDADVNLVSKDQADKEGQDEKTVETKENKNKDSDNVNSTNEQVKVSSKVGKKDGEERKEKKESKF